MSESLKGLAREEVAARRAALTDGRWRNRQGVGMYQRSTSNALRNILSGVKSVLPSLPRTRSKSRSRSISPRKRAALVSENPVESPKAGPSRLGPDSSPARPGPSPARPARSRRSSIRSRRNSSAVTNPSLLSPRTNSTPARRSNPSPLRKSNLSPFQRSELSPVREPDSSPARQPDPSPVRKPSSRKSDSSPTRKSSTTKPKPQPKSESKLKLNKGKDSEPEPSAPISPRERPASVEAPEPEDESPPDEVENEPPTVEDPEPDRSASVQPDASGDGLDESMVIQKDPVPDVPKTNKKVKPRIQQDTAANDSVVVLEETAPEVPPPRKKNRIQTIVPEPVQRPKPAQSRKVSGKRPAVEDDEERAEGSPPKRAKSNKGKSKAKAPAKKGKTTKAKSRKKAPAARAISVESEPEPERATPPPQDIMVPLQDSPPARPKDKRRRYTLMPVRTKEEMLHPDYDPIDCIGWQ
ncbi:unnamed protein product [Rhizoctonia solani]|uniref:Uncharacterized protein n=1 Tax=Rhizoctonia solani TaxID=456999 RepID=A0A8H3DRE8_9AGAM|nr:unnamed protein product [Rhizoctonia solani]